MGEGVSHTTVVHGEDVPVPGGSECRQSHVYESGRGKDRSGTSMVDLRSRS